MKRIALLFLLILVPLFAHAQGLDGVKVYNNGTLVHSWAGGFGSINFTTSVSCSWNAGTKRVDCAVTGSGGGTVTNTGGDLTANRLVLGAGSTDSKVLGSLGTTTTVLHGNAAGVPSFAAVVEADLNLTDLTTADVSTTKHGFVPKGDNNAAHFLDGTGAWTTPAGGGTVTHAAGNLTSGQVMIGNGTADAKVDTGCSTDGAGKMTCTGGFVSGGAGSPDVFTAIADGTTANSFWLSSTTANTFKAYVGGALKVFAFTDSALSGNTSGTAANVSGTPALPNGTTATTQSAADNSTKLATTAYADAVLASRYKVRACELVIWGTGASNVLQDTDDWAADCKNKFGATWTITAVECYADAGSPTFMLTKTGNNNVLSGNLTCGTATWAAGTLTGTGADKQVASDGTLDFNVVSAGGVAHYIRVLVTGTI